MIEGGLANIREPSSFVRRLRKHSIPTEEITPMFQTLPLFAIVTVSNIGIHGRGLTKVLP